jgi:hypothetical protein
LLKTLPINTLLIFNTEMKHLKYTLIADGSSDSTLLKVINWTLNDLYPNFTYEEKFADFRSLKNPPKTLEDKIKEAYIRFPFDILFIHRDAESVNPKNYENRINEIKAVLREEHENITVCIVPVKMMENWLLIDKEALKKAAGNRNFKGNIDIPTLRNLEGVNQPKEKLHNLLREISGLKGRNLDKFNVHQAVHLVADYIDDFSTLRNLDSYMAFEDDLKRVMNMID